jgi:hypothetical protein
MLVEWEGHIVAVHHIPAPLLDAEAIVAKVLCEAPDYVK